MKKSISNLILRLALFSGIAIINPACSIFTEEKEEVVVIQNDTCSTVETTEFVLVNNTFDTVSVWLTLNIYTDTLKNYYIQNVFGIFGITDSGAVGNLNLLPKDTLYYNSAMALAGNICFGGQPVNCSNKQFPYGTNIFEFCLNNNFGLYPQESVEISCVAGVNSYIIGRLNGDYWNVTTGIDTVRTFRNATFGNNTGLYGVFPTGCTNCTNQDGAPVCTPKLPFDKPNNKPICIIQRPAVGSGGSVFCYFNGYTPNICNK